MPTGDFNPKVCPNCGTCPTCGQSKPILWGTFPYSPVINPEPWYPYIPIWIVPQPQWINPVPVITYTTASTSGITTFTTS